MAANIGAGLGASSELDRLESSLPRLQLSASLARSSVCVCLTTDKMMANKAYCDARKKKLRNTFG